MTLWPIVIPAASALGGAVGTIWLQARSSSQQLVRQLAAELKTATRDAREALYLQFVRNLRELREVEAVVTRCEDRLTLVGIPGTTEQTRELASDLVRFAAKKFRLSKDVYSLSEELTLMAPKRVQQAATNLMVADRHVFDERLADFLVVANLDLNSHQ